MSTDELFPADAMEALSPRLQWMREHNVNTKYRSDLEGDDTPKWECYKGDDWADAVEKVFGAGTTLDGKHRYYPCDNPDFTIGDSEHEVLALMAERNDWKLWNEEDA